MKNQQQQQQKALDTLIEEAKEDFVPRDVDIHWGRVEEKMMARIAEEETPLLRDRRASGTGRARALRVTAIALAAAAAVAVVVRRDRDTSLVDATAPAATVNRPWSSECIATSNPCPSSPIRFSAGTSTFSKKSSPVDPAQIPSLCSVSRVVKPFIPFSSTKALIPLCPAAGSVFANTSA